MSGNEDILKKYHPYRTILVFGQLDDMARQQAAAVDESELRKNMEDSGGPLDVQGLRNLLSGVIFEDAVVENLAGKIDAPKKRLKEFASSVSGLMTTLSGFVNTRGHIFDLSGGHLQSLVETPIDDVGWQDIRWSSRKPIYLHFGNDQFEVSEDMILEGAYVERGQYPRGEMVLEIDLIAKRKSELEASDDALVDYWYAQDHCAIYVEQEGHLIDTDMRRTLDRDFLYSEDDGELIRWGEDINNSHKIVINALRALMPARRNSVPEELALPAPTILEEGPMTIHRIANDQADESASIEDGLSRTTDEFVAKLCRLGLRAGARGKTGAHKEDLDSLKRLVQSASMREIGECLEILEARAAVARGVMRALTQLERVPHAVLQTCLIGTETETQGLFDDVWTWLDDTLDGLDEHLAQGHLDCPVELHGFVDSSSGNESLTLEVVVRYNRPMQPTFLWDRRTIRTKVPILYCLPLSILVDEVDYQPRTIKRWKPNPLFRYHPERFRYTRSHIDETVRVMQSLGDALQTPEGMQAMTEPMFREMQKGSGEIPLVEKKKRPDPGAKHLGTEISFAINYNNFKAGGRQIFDLDPELVTMFKHTSVDDVPVDLLVSPFELYYLHFGPQEDLEFGDGWYVDGVYITHRPDHQSIQFLFTSRPSVDEEVTNWHTFEEPCFVLSFDKEHHELSISEAVDRVIASKAAELDEKIGKGDRDISEEIHEMADAEGLVLPAKQIVETNETHGRVQKAQLAERHPVMRRALDIAVNALCYLTAYHDDIVEEWPTNTPERLLKAAETGSPKQRKRNISKLNALGYQKVYLCGQAIKQEQKHSEGRTVRTHWRRGHWRRQAYGPKKALRKLILLKPMLINPEKEKREGEALGHIYIGKNLPGPDETIH
jgi:hypothetical protein